MTLENYRFTAIYPPTFRVLACHLVACSSFFARSRQRPTFSMSCREVFWVSKLGGTHSPSAGVQQLEGEPRTAWRICSKHFHINRDLLGGTEVLYPWSLWPPWTALKSTRLPRAHETSTCSPRSCPCSIRKNAYFFSCVEIQLHRWYCG